MMVWVIHEEDYGMCRIYSVHTSLEGAKKAIECEWRGPYDDGTYNADYNGGIIAISAWQVQP
jgi:hypothetical protein